LAETWSSLVFFFFSATHDFSAEWLLPWLMRPKKQLTLHL
jgi:hypothetical protein